MASAQSCMATGYGSLCTGTPGEDHKHCTMLLQSPTAKCLHEESDCGKLNHAIIETQYICILQILVNGDEVQLRTCATCYIFLQLICYTFILEFNKKI